MAILVALDELGATPDQPYIKNSKTVRVVEDGAGFGYRYAFEALCDLARPWRAPLSLVDFQGNYGSGPYPAAPARLTESRLSRAGFVAVAAERGDGGALPIGLINGSCYQGGERPPFDAVRMIDTLLVLLDDPAVSDATVLDLVGEPSFPDHCHVLRDVEAVLAGRREQLTLLAHLEVDHRGATTVVVVSRFPPERWADGVVSALAPHCSPAAWTAWVEANYLEPERARLPIADVRDVSAGASDHSHERVEIVLDDGADSAVVVARLRGDAESFVDDGDEADFGVRHDFHGDLGSSLPQLLRNWIAMHPAVEATRSLAELRRIVADQ